jgi:uncharacterized protein YfiM (DUF2279 family)
MRIFLIFFLISFIAGKILSQDSLKFFSSSVELDKRRMCAIVSLQTIGYGGSLVFLSKAWYNNYHQTSFHFFDDSREWLQMDKAGHIFTSYYLGRIGTDIMIWSGVEKRKSIWYGTAGSSLYLTGIEISDGFSDGWGFSLSDFSANALGTGLIIWQRLLQNGKSSSSILKGVGEISLKFSFHQTDYPKYRPSLLGKNLAENIVKDYNGQTYWLSANLSALCPPLNEPSAFPKWLNLAFGYGAEGMIGGKGNPPTDESGNPVSFQRQRKYYLSLDIDFSRIKTKSAFLKTIFETFSFLKIPAPAVEVSNKGVKWYAIFY